VSKDTKIIIDAFAGTGGNTIAFALSGHWNQIFAVEKDQTTLNCAKHNAEVYGVEKKITWIHGDVFTALQTRLKFAAKKAVIFGSPPWGGQSIHPRCWPTLHGSLTLAGPEYADQETFNLDTMEPYSLDVMYKAFSTASSNICLFLPRTSDLLQLVRYADTNKKLKVRHYCANLNSKALCVYYGDFEFE